MRVRKLLSEEQFKSIFLWSFCVLGVYLMLFGEVS